MIYCCNPKIHTKLTPLPFGGCVLNKTHAHTHGLLSCSTPQCSQSDNSSTLASPLACWPSRHPDEDTLTQPVTEVDTVSPCVRPHDRKAEIGQKSSYAWSGQPWLHYDDLLLRDGSSSVHCCCDIDLLYREPQCFWASSSPGQDITDMSQRTPFSLPESLNSLQTNPVLL